MLKSLSIAHYKSYYDRCEIKFATPKEGSLGLTLLVGGNNAGKSTILTCISTMLGARSEYIFDRMDRHPDHDPSLEFEYCLGGVDQTIGLKKAADAYYSKTVRLSHSQEYIDYRTTQGGGQPLVAYVPSRRPWEDTLQGGASDLKGFESARESMGDQARLGNRQLERLGDQLKRIIELGDKKNFDEILKSVLPDLHDWTTDRVAGQDRIMYISSNGIAHAIRDAGDGVVSVFRLCFALHMYPDSVPLVLDEPELSLHPDGQRRLYAVIREHAKKRQIIIATHSPHFIHWKDLVSGAKVYRVSQNRQGQSSAFSASEKTLRDVYSVAYKDFKNRKLFDYLGKEIFLNSEALLVEGQEDVHIISRFLEDEGEAELPIFAYGAGGAPHIVKWVRLARELGLNVAAVYDADTDKEYSHAAEEFKGDAAVKIVKSHHDDIRDKSMNGVLKKIGYFDESWNIKPSEKEKFQALVTEIRRHFHDNGRASRFSPSAHPNVIDFKMRLES
jgi:predicted ATP-dependent endonuclease of OLD family